MVDSNRGFDRCVVRSSSIITITIINILAGNIASGSTGEQRRKRWAQLLGAVPWSWCWCWRCVVGEARAGAGCGSREAGAGRSARSPPLPDRPPPYSRHPSSHPPLYLSRLTRARNPTPPRRQPTSEPCEVNIQV